MRAPAAGNTQMYHRDVGNFPMQVVRRRRHRHLEGSAPKSDRIIEMSSCANDHMGSSSHLIFPRFSRFE